ncbi:hypothetical protein FDP41_001867 [Naegleria fowleri]|uniref:TLC domain-containing protein n=1 Tax=Naegleria fowleri TaxID=5763 RepID=A0A6A5BNY4_NAEFO|nr:uncharacterized protein FDP41_001867 [Naegleria fowleri]KAF0978797.1 hypothetical protein FDP41_001867 [Naegleria fowleri]CAG4708831.1 unnamed protein product [Naegleria fowleri]
MDQQIIPSVITDTLTSLGLSIPQQVLVGSLAFHLIMYLFVMKILCLTLINPSFYKTLSKRDQNEYESRVISSLHSFVVAFGGIAILFNDHVFLYDWNITHRSLATECLFYFSTGYMLIDLMFVLYYYPQIGGIEMVIHHVFVSTGQICLVECQIGEVLGVWVTQTEHTTFFINMRWFLDKAGMKDCSIYIFNGLMMWLVWFLVRIGYAVFNVVFFVRKWDEWMKLIEERGTYGMFHFVFLTIQCVNLGYLNVMWFTKLTRGVIKALFSKDVKKKNA